MKAPKIPLKLPQITSNEFCRAMYEVQTAKEVRALIFAAAASSKIDDDIFLGCISQVYNCCPLEKVNPDVYPACKFCDQYEYCDVYNHGCKEYQVSNPEACLEVLKEMLKGDNDNV